MTRFLKTTAIALLLASPAFAQEPAADAVEAEPDAAPGEVDLEDEAEVGGAFGLATGAVGETFFIRTPQEFHLLTSELPGHPVFFDTTPTGMARPVTEEPEAAGTVEQEIREGEVPVGVVTDVLIDRRGGAAGLVIELNEEMRGGGREIAVAMGLVRMLPDPDDPAATHILLSIDPVDVEAAPDFERPGAPADGAAAQPQDAGPAGDAADGPEAGQAGEEAEGMEAATGHGAAQPQQ